MKDCFCLGMLLGLAVGAILVKNSPDMKKLVEKGEKLAKESMSKIKSNS